LKPSTLLAAVNSVLLLSYPPLCYNKSMEKPLLVLFDGNNIVHRAFHAFATSRPLTVSKTGEVISAVYVFALMLLKIINELKLPLGFG